MGSTWDWPFLLFLLQIILPLTSVAFISFLVACVLQLCWLISHQHSQMWNSYLGELSHMWERFLGTVLVTFPQSYFSGSFICSLHVTSGSQANGKLTSIHSTDIRVCLVQTGDASLRAPLSKSHRRMSYNPSAGWLFLPQTLICT